MESKSILEYETGIHLMILILRKKQFWNEKLINFQIITALQHQIMYYIRMKLS